MGYLKIIFYGLLAFVERNPLFTLLLVLLAIFAPVVFKVAGWIILGILLAIVVLVAIGSLRLRRMRQQMEEQMRGSFRGGQGGPSAGYNPYGGGSTRRPNEGEVQVHITSETPEKRVSKDVGDYVEFEETPEKR